MGLALQLPCRLTLPPLPTLSLHSQHTGLPASLSALPLAGPSDESVLPEQLLPGPCASLRIFSGPGTTIFHFSTDMLGFCLLLSGMVIVPEPRMVAHVIKRPMCPSVLWQTNDVLRNRTAKAELRTLLSELILSRY